MPCPLPSLRSLALWGILLLGPSLAGCSGESGAPKAESTTVHSGGHVVIGLDADPYTLNPVQMGNAQAARVFALLQPGLVRLDPETGDWTGGLARSWSYDGDSTAITLALDTSLRWSDGAPFGSADVARTYELYLDPQVGYPRAARLGPIASVEEIDEAHVRVRFSEKPADALLLLTHDILPAHVVTTLDRQDPSSWSIGRAPITLGPYRLKSWATNESLILERNPFHPGRPGHLETIEVKIVPDAAARLLQLRTGELDIVASVPQTQAETLIEDPEVEITPVSGRSVAFLQYDLEDPRLADARVRRAISHAVDRRAIVDGILFGYGTPAASFLPPVSWAHDDALEPDAHDPAAARALLREAGCTDENGDGILECDGARMDLTMHTVAGDPVREAIATALQTQLRAVGIAVSLRPMDLGSLIRSLREEDFDLVFLQLSGPVDTDLRPFLTTGAQFNFGGYSNPAFDELADAATGASDRSIARENALAYQKILAAEHPVTPLYYPATLVAHRQRLHGVEPTWLSPFDGFEVWWVADAGDAR